MMRRLPALIAVILIAAIGWWFLREPEAEEAKRDEDEAGEARVLAKPFLSADPRELPKSQLASLSGLISGPDGAPATGAQACFSYAGKAARSWFGSEATCVAAKDDGHYEIKGVIPGEVTIFAQAPGFLAHYFVRDSVRGQDFRNLPVAASARLQDLDIELAKGAVKLVGVVEDLSGGVIEGAMVRGRSSERGARASASPLTLSDAQGRFELWVRPGAIQVSAWADGYSRRSKSAAAPGSTPPIRLTPESAIEGLVVDAISKKPVAGLQIYASKRGGGSGRPVRSDEAGRFRIGQLAPGRFSVSASGPAHYGHLSDVLLAFASNAEIRIEVHPAQLIEGVVAIAPGDEPCEGAQVNLTARKESRFHGLVADAQGYGRIEGVLPGEYKVTLSCSGYLSPAESADLVVRAGEAVPKQSWKVEVGKTLRGVLVDSSGEPVTGLSVRATLKDPQAALGWGQTQRVEDPTGAWELHGLQVGLTTVEVSGGFWNSMMEPVQIEISSEGEAPELRLEVMARGGIRGAVRTVDGKAVAAASVRASGGGPMGTRGTTTDTGEFHLKDVPVGPSRVSASRDGSSMRAPGTNDDDRQGEVVEVLAGEEVEVELIVEAADGVLTGRVLGADGAPLVDAFVSVTRINDSKAASTGASTRAARSVWGQWRNEPELSDQDGRFRIEGLSEGLYLVRAYHKEGGDAVAEDVELGSEVELRIAALGSLSGHLSSPGSEPPENFRVKLSDAQSGRELSADFYRTEGAFEFGGLEAGSYKVLATSSSGDAQLDALEIGEGESVEGLTLELARKLALRGRAVDDETGEPIAGLRAIASRDGSFGYPGASDKHGPEVTDDSGSFLIENAVSEARTLFLLPLNFRDSKYGWVPFPIRIPEGVSEHDLGDVPLMALRIDPMEGAGDIGFRLANVEPETEAEDRHSIVAVVTPGGPAAAGGMKVGDEVVAVDGREIVGIHWHRFPTLTRVEPGTKLVFTIQDGRTVTLVAGPVVGR